MARLMKSMIALLLLCIIASFCESKPFYRWVRRYNYKRDDNAVNEHACLKKLNEIRSAYKAVPLKWDPYLVKHALAWAKKLVASNKIEHDFQQIGISDREGENIYFSKSGPATCVEALDNWERQSKIYKAKGACEVPPINAPPGTEDFTQLVWDSTDTVGVAVVGKVVVARFFPRGNFVKEYEFDVKC